MNPVESVKTVLSKYATFSGRARRSEYWWFVLFSAVLGFIAGILDFVVFGAGGREMVGDVTSGPIALVLTLALLIPSLAVAVRRLHDTDRSGWWVLLGLIPIIGGIILIVFYATDSKPDNRFGPRPKPAGAY